ncbi:HEPN domain-containing protein [Heliobacterium undosum]|uniref:HEPN domain-containing protein n=1 Tax=Heliomicrobium undosum TaxID=121734 RepID=A0A845LE70_9FIRM|nr:HEPN domain-containing protein [Heliomicrobium undosum]MZP31211.1 HEPN domain-containing protein [Heliomicrobium undosum]
MSLTEQEKRELALWWKDKAKENLLTAKSDLDAGRLGNAMRAMYYSAFNAVRSALAISGRDDLGQKHTAVRAALNRDFIKTGIIESKYGKIYEYLFNARQKADYKALTIFEPQATKIAFRETVRFVQVFEKVVDAYLSGQEPSKLLQTQRDDGPDR